MSYINAYDHSQNTIDWYPDIKGKYGPSPPVSKTPKNAFKLASPYISYSYGGKAATISSSCNVGRSGGDYGNPAKIFG